MGGIPSKQFFLRGKWFTFNRWGNSKVCLILVCDIYDKKIVAAIISCDLARISENLLLIIGSFPGVLKVKGQSFDKRAEIEKYQFCLTRRVRWFSYFVFQTSNNWLCHPASHKFVLPNWHAYWAVEIVFTKLILSKLCEMPVFFTLICTIEVWPSTNTVG